MNRHVVIFARMPRYGRVKTRLARDIGKMEALRFYRKNLLNLYYRFTGLPTIKLHLSFASDTDSRHGFLPLWPKTLIKLQGKGNLGNRMVNVFKNAPAGEPMIILGSDAPNIEHTHISTAFRALGHNDVVFGPAEDGGYWLVGLKRGRAMPPHFMKQVRWSTKYALQDTVATLPKHWKIAYINVLSDIDTGADLKAWKSAERD